LANIRPRPITLASSARSAFWRISPASDNQLTTWRRDFVDFVSNPIRYSTQKKLQIFYTEEATDILIRAIYHHAQDIRPQLFD